MATTIFKLKLHIAPEARKLTVKVTMKIITKQDGITNKSLFLLVAVCSGIAMAVMTAISMFTMFPEALESESFWFAPLMIIIIPLFNSIFLAGITCLTYMMIKKTKIFEFVSE